ncbi:hypothetical protein QUF63_08855 [Anaerolineales bacterium HSG25]|nr:hypothetical protein [Anaerolineales bacterium HSG25]
MSSTSTDSTAHVLKQWKLEQIEIERAVGQTLLHVNRLDTANEANRIEHIKLTNAIEAINISLHKLRDDVDALIVFTGMPPLKR